VRKKKKKRVWDMEHKTTERACHLRREVACHDSCRNNGKIQPGKGGFLFLGPTNRKSNLVSQEFNARIDYRKKKKEEQRYRGLHPFDTT